MGDEWHYHREGKQAGPLSASDLKRLAASGKLSPNDLVWKEGLPNWVAAHRVKGLFSDNLVRSAPPPAPITLQPQQMPGFSSGSQLAVSQLREGQFSFSGPYPLVFSTLEKALTDCGVSIKERSTERGLLRGKCKYGINPFGITVTATMHAAGTETRAEIAASLTDAFDTFGACSKKVVQISDRIIELSNTGAVGAVSGLSSNTLSAPQYSQRAGASYRGKALAGFWLSILGLCFGPAAIVGLVMCGIALTGMTASPNQDGKGWAIAGSLLGFVAVLGWLMLVLMQVEA